MRAVNDKIYLTPDGFSKIREEFRSLKEERRPVVVERLSLARLQGDLSENNEYAAAKEELAFIDGRIEELEEVLQRVCVMDESQGPRGDCVSFGSKVTVRQGGQEQLYHVVGEWEADPAQKKVSHSSPLGQALLGKKVGETVEFEAPAGKIVFRVVKIE